MARLERKPHRLIVSNHAWDRLAERSAIHSRRSKMQYYLQCKLNQQLQRGLRLDKTGAAWIEIDPELWASVRLDNDAWVVTTVIRMDKGVVL